MYSKRKNTQYTNKNAFEISLSAVKFSLELSQSAMKFRSNYRGVPRYFARTSRSAVKYRCRSNNRTREISLKNRSKRNFAYYRLLSLNIREIRRITFALLLHNTVY